MRKILTMRKKNSYGGFTSQAQANGISRRILMSRKHLAGLALLSAGSVGLIGFFLPLPEAVAESSVFAGFGVATLAGALLAMRGRHQAAFLRLPAVLMRRNMAPGPAKRLKIRIRCAR